MPREEKFFEQFNNHARTLVDGAVALRDLLEGGAGVADACRRIVAHENEADIIARDVLIGVRRSFITPFDRGDIKDLIGQLDDTIDQYVSDVPNGDRITLRMLADMTSGLASYTRSAAFTDVLFSKPETAWTPQQVLRIGLDGSPIFEPGRTMVSSQTGLILLITSRAGWSRMLCGLAAMVRIGL